MAQDGAYSVTIGDGVADASVRSGQGRADGVECGGADRGRGLARELPEHYPHVELDAVCGDAGSRGMGLLCWWVGIRKRVRIQARCWGVGFPVASREEEAGLKPARTQESARAEEAGGETGPKTGERDVGPGSAHDRKRPV